MLLERILKKKKRQKLLKAQGLLFWTADWHQVKKRWKFLSTAFLLYPQRKKQQVSQKTLGPTCVFAQDPSHSPCAASQVALPIALASASTSQRLGWDVVPGLWGLGLYCHHRTELLVGMQGL